MRSPAFLTLSAAVAARYLPAGRFAHGFAKGKLNSDPAFEYLLRQGLLNQSTTIVDIGCGQGLLTGLLQAVASKQVPWPNDWAPPPLQAKVVGIELMERDVLRARAALGPEAQFIVGDMVTTAFPPAQSVVILDVLHYVPFEAQEQVLQRVLASLKAGAAQRTGEAITPRLLLRVGDADAGLPFKMSNWVDSFVTFIRGHRLSRLYCRPLTQWESLLKGMGFITYTQSLSEGTPFANVLIIAELAPQ
jgi:SAM-dependent methyltransferase